MSKANPISNLRAKRPNFQFLISPAGLKFLGGFFVVLAIIGILFIYNKPEIVEATWWNDSWNYRKSLTINSDQVAGDLTNFPVLVSLTDTNLSGHAQEDGDDFIFIDREGNKLSHEIESYASSTGELVAWVKMPSLSSTQDIDIYLYYGNPSASSGQVPEDVWDDNYKGVWHLNDIDSVSSTTPDSSINNYDGTVTSAITTASGQITEGLSFIGGVTSVTASPGTVINTTGSGGTEDWININNIKTNDSNYAYVVLEVIFCLSPETLISLATGSVKIKDIKEGMMVKSYNESSGSIELREVQGVFSRSISNYGNVYYRIVYDGGELKSTFNHKFYVSGQYIMAEELKVGDELTDILGNSRRINEIILEDNFGDEVWDIIVADNHNFFANGVLVHNAIGEIEDYHVKIVDENDTVGTTEKALAGTWPTTAAYHDYGGDLWGETWTASDINDSDFGMVFSASGDSYSSRYFKATNYGFSIPTEATIDTITAEINKRAVFSGDGQAWVYHVQMTIEYTNSGGGGGGSENIDIGNVGTVNTISFWIKADQDYDKKIIDIDGTDQIELSAGGVLQATSFPSATVYVDGAVASDISTSTWHYVTIVDSSGVNATSLNFATSSFEGILDEVRVSNSVRSSAWIQTEYNNQNDPTAFFAVGDEEFGPGPVGSWSLDMGYGTTVIDKSGQSGNGTITGADWADEVECVTGKCLYFDGDSDYVELPDIDL